MTRQSSTRDNTLRREALELMCYRPWFLPGDGNSNPGSEHSKETTDLACEQLKKVLDILRSQQVKWGERASRPSNNYVPGWKK